MENLIEVDVFPNESRNLHAATKNSRQNVDQGMSLEEQRHRDQ